MKYSFQQEQQTREKRMTKIDALCMQRKVAEDMYKSAKSKKEKEFYQNEIDKISVEISNMIEHD